MDNGFHNNCELGSLICVGAFKERVLMEVKN